MHSAKRSWQRCACAAAARRRTARRRACLAQATPALLLRAPATPPLPRAHGELAGAGGCDTDSPVRRTAKAICAGALLATSAAADCPLRYSRTLQMRLAPRSSVRLGASKDGTLVRRARSTQTTHLGLRRGPRRLGWPHLHSPACVLDRLRKATSSEGGEAGSASAPHGDGASLCGCPRGKRRRGLTWTLANVLLRRVRRLQALLRVRWPMSVSRAMAARRFRKAASPMLGAVRRSRRSVAAAGEQEQARKGRLGEGTRTSPALRGSQTRRSAQRRATAPSLPVRANHWHSVARATRRKCRSRAKPAARGRLRPCSGRLA
jgi:hypothetical protein